MMVTALAVITAALVPVSSAHASATTQPTRGGTVTGAFQTVPANIDPALIPFSGYNNAPLLEAVYGPGLVWTIPKSGEVKMGFAQSLTTRNHGRSWTLVLRPGLKFSDGTAFNAAAVADNIARMANPATGSSYQVDASQLVTKVINKTTLLITPTILDTQLPSIMASEFSMIPSPTAIAQEGANFGVNPVGPGPFKVTQYVSGLSWSFTRNSYYSHFAPGQPYLNNLVLESSPVISQTISALQTGQIQMTDPTGRLQINEMAAIPGIRVQQATAPGGVMLMLNTAIPPFNNVLARQAIALAIDRTATVAVWNGPGSPGNYNFFPKTSPYYNPKLDWPKQDSAKAQALFDQLAAAGTPVNFRITWPAGGLGNVGAYLPGALASYRNLTVTDESTTLTGYGQEINTGTFQMVPYSVGTYIPGAMQAFSIGGSRNKGAWNDPKASAALQDINSTTNQARIAKDWNVVTQELVTQEPVIFVGYSPNGFAYSNKIAGVTVTEFCNVAFWGPMYLKK